MQKKYACVRYLHTRVTVYHPCKIDLRYSRALHSCVTCHFLRVGLPCSAIHYGVCRALAFPAHQAQAPGPSPSRSSPSASPSSPSSSSSPSPASPAAQQQQQTSVTAGPTAPAPALYPAAKPAGGGGGAAAAPRPIPIPVVSLSKKPSSASASPSAASSSSSSSSPVVVVVSNHVGPERGPGPARLHAVGGPHSALAGPAHAAGHGPAVLRTGPAAGAPRGVGVSVQSVGPTTTQVVVRTGPDGGGGLPRGGVVITNKASVAGGARVPVRVQVVSKPAPPSSSSSPSPSSPSSVPASFCPSSGLSFSFSAAEDEVYPAFPVSAEDKMQLTVPNGNQKDLHHGVLREKETQPQGKDVAPGDHINARDAALKDSKTASRTAPAATSSTTSITLSSTSSTLPTRQENKENKPQTRELPMPRVPVTVRSEDIPQFHYPLGKPLASADVDAVIQKATAEFATYEGGKAYKQQMGQLAKACGFPMYWKILLFRAAGGDKQGFLTLQSFSTMLKKVFATCHDDASRFVRLLAKPGRMVLEFDDLVSVVQDVVDCHPGLSFLQDAPEFHSRYIHTVVSRIFFCVNRSWTGRITVTELRKSNFLQTLALLEEEEDINQVTEYFSYEHFYVIYCKFWELDKDHDLFIDKADLARHNDHALNSRIIDRIFSGAVTRGKDFQEGRMSYKEFVWFLISEEDKKHPTSIEYWFRCMDLDGDGVISMYEMEYFYEEQMQKMEALGIEKLPFEDCLCQMFDLVRPRVEERITLMDLKNCRMANIFFDTFFNLDKFLEHEQRDPFANARDFDAAGNEISDWDRYAAEEYDILVAEEGMNDQEEIHYEDDFEPDDDDMVEEEIARLADPPQRKVTPRLHPATNDDIYDFSSNSLGF